ncbi:malate/lactate/ureidoglycolate dehydrogenase [Alphaproteobacteria bacterium]|nr:malate/lactate/ureidoglycolate dehydrogenase [Alphaproteobacteria bacterium]
MSNKNNNPEIRVKVKDAIELISEIFQAKACNDYEAKTIAERLCGSNLKGHDSHGIVRVPRYVEWMERDWVFPNIESELVIDAGALACLDAKQGFGQVAGERAVDEGITRAKKHGVSVVGLKNSGHLGRIGDWAERAADAGFVSFHFVNVRGSLLVAPFGGTDRRGSTSPLAIGIPTKGKEHIILDMATSTVAEGKVMVAQKGGKPLPQGALIDSSGNLTINPEVMYGKISDDEVPDSENGSGAITAFGLHKGSGINFMMEMLGGALTGSGVSAGIDDKEKRKFANGMLSIYISVEKMVDLDYFSKEVQSYADFVRASPASDKNGKVLIPGDKEIITNNDRLANGLPVAPIVWQNIKQTAQKLEIPNLERFEKAIV